MPNGDFVYIVTVVVLVIFQLLGIYYFDFQFSSDKPIPEDDSSSDEEPLAKKSKKQPPTVSSLIF